MFKKLNVFLLIFIFSLFLFPIFVSAKTTIADLSVGASSTYTFDNTKIEFSDGTARLKASSPWLGSAWSWNQVITVTNPTIFTNTSTELKVTITSANTEFWNHVESDGRSVRFTSSDGITPLNYYMESFDSVGQTATIYVVIPLITRETTATIYMYFGNSSAASQSSAANTFYFDETFSSSTIDASKYSIIDANGVFSQNGTQLLAGAFEGGSLWHGIYATSSYSVSPTSGLVFEADFSTTNVLNKDQNFLIGLKNTNTETTTLFFASMKYDLYINGGYSGTCSNYSIRYNYDGTNTVDSGYDIACDTTYNTRIVVYPSNGADYFIKGGAFTDWTYLGHSILNYTSPMVFSVLKQEGQATIDNVRIRHSTITATSDGYSLPRYPSLPLDSASEFSEPSILYEDGMFKMWYSTITGNPATGYSTSSDGITWSPGTVVLSPSGVNGTFDKTVASRADVIKDAGIYYMYYNGFEVDQNGAGKIGLATSTDGINWNRYSGNPILSTSIVAGWESGSLYNNAVVKVAGIWYMLYEARGVTTNEIGLATSTDGITWSKYVNNPVITNGLAGSSAGYAAAPNLIYANGKFYTWFLYDTGVDNRYRMARAYSTDGINWTRYGVADMSARDAWEYISVSDPSNPIEYNGSVYMYYLGGNQAGIAAIGLIKYTGTINSLVNSSTPFLFSSTTVPFQELSQIQSTTNSFYAITSPSLISPGVPYDKITAFSATTTGSGSVTFQISNDGASWYYWNGSAWVAASGSAQSNSTSTINTNIVTFSDAHPSGTFYWRAYLTSNGAQNISLTNVSIVTNIFPTVTIDAISGYKNSSVTVTYQIIDPDNDTVNFAQTATSGIEFSLDGNIWSDATASTTGDGLTDLTSTSSPGQAHSFVWDTITDASTTESNTVYLRFRPNDGIDFATSWTTSTVFGLDNVAPTAVDVPTYGTITATSIEVIKPTTVTEGGSGLNQWQVRRDDTFLSSAVSTSTTSTIVSGLSANTQYTFDVRFTDIVNSTSTFGSSTTKYTAANIPSLLSATVDTATQITLTWSGDASQYYVENTTASTNSGWQASTQKSFSGLSCGTAYTFRVKGRNSEQLETDWSSEVSVTTSGCGGGSFTATPPSVPVSTLAVILNNQKIETDSRLVTLNFSVINAIQVAISEDPGFAGASWDTYTPTKSFTLSAGAGEKTIYVKFRSASGGVTATYKVNVTLKPDYAPSQVVTPVVSTSGEVVTPVVTAVAQFEVSNPDSKVVIAPVKTLVYKPNSVVKYTYSYKNETTKTVKIKVVRSVVDTKGKVVNKITGSASIAKGKTFKFNASSPLSNKVAEGNYTVKVQILDFKKGTLIDENSFDITVKKPLPPPTITSNNPDSKVVITGLKVDYKPGNVVKYTYLYKNETTKTVKIKVVRQVVDYNGKVVSQATGTRTLYKGQIFKFNATNILNRKILVGVYSVEIKILNSKNKVLDENGFNITVKK